MTTRNQKKRENAKTKPNSSIHQGVDFVKQPIVALPAVNPPSSHSDFDRKHDDNMGSGENQSIPSNLLKSSSSQAGESAANLKNSLSSPAASVKNTSSSPAGKHAQPPAAVTPAAVTPPRNTTSNPVLKDIFALKAGELKVVSPAVSKYFGFPAGPVENLNFNDPKVAEFFGIQLPAAAVIGAVPVTGDTVQAARNEVAALVPTLNPVPTQNPNTTVTSTPAATNTLQSSTAAVGSSSVINGSSARPIPEAAGNNNPTTQTTPTASWVGLFKGNRALNDDTKMNTNYSGVSNVDVNLIDDDLYDDDEEKRSLIGFFNGKFPGIKAIQSIVDAWPRKCSFHLHNSGWLVFTFDEEKDCDIVMKEGPYAFNKPLVLKRMPEYFDFSDEAYSTAPVWIQLPNLPHRAWKKSALEKICTFLGTPLHIDLVTRDKTQKSFARCLVEIDVSKDLPRIVCCNLPGGKVLRQHVLYEEIPTFCTNCKKLGHETDDCYANNNGMPSLYVTRSKREREKKMGNKSGNKSGIAGGAKGVVKGPGKQATSRPVHTSRPVAVPATNGATGEQVSHGIDEAVDGVPRAKSSVYNNNNTKAVNIGKDVNNTTGKATETFKTGFVSTNSFGPLANEKVGSWADDAEASNARDNNKQKKINGKKK